MVILSVWTQDTWILVAEMLEGKIFDGIHLLEQGSKHDSISHVRVGRGGDAVYRAFWQKFRPTAGRTDRLSDVTKKYVQSIDEITGAGNALFRL